MQLGSRVGEVSFVLNGAVPCSLLAHISLIFDCGTNREMVSHPHTSPPGFYVPGHADYLRRRRGDPHVAGRAVGTGGKEGAAQRRATQLAYGSCANDCAAPVSLFGHRNPQCRLRCGYLLSKREPAPPL